MLSCKLYPVLHLAPPPARPSVPLTSGHLSCTDTFAWSRGCPFMTGTTVVECTASANKRRSNSFSNTESHM